MKVLFQNRPDVFETMGGDTTQMIETKNELEKLGVEVDINLNSKVDLNEYDLIHIFNIQDPHYAIKFFKNANKYGLPTVISPIYWDLRYYQHSKDRFIYSDLYIPRILGKINKNIPYFLSKIRLYNTYKKERKYMEILLNESDMVLPNSYSELEIITTLFQMPQIRQKALVVPNGISLPDKEKSVNNKHLKLPEDYVLEVGRLKPYKSQLNLIKSLYNHPEIPIVFIGGNLDSYYGKACIKLGKKRGNTFFLGEIPHDQIYSYYSKAKVHSLPSLRESPGLSTLEAAISGINCVVSFHGPINEYFGFDAFYCDPLNINSIENAVLAAFKSPKKPNLKKRILKYFTWERAAKKTLEAYEHIIR